MTSTHFQTHTHASLPDLFQFNDGRRVQSASDWRRRRGELLDLLLEIEYGHLPPTPPRVGFEELHTHPVARFDQAIHATYRILIEDGPRRFAFNIDLMMPPGGGPFPVVLCGDGCWKYVTDAVISEVLARGYLLAVFNRTEIVPDINNSQRTTGLYRVYPDGDYGALAAWAWGYHRAVDFLTALPQTDAGKISIVGHSRGGKATLLAGATDERIALVGSNNSGHCGAGSFLIRNEGSETLADSIRMFPYWFSAKLAEYIGREKELPFDQHLLKALIAPRALVTTEALGDLWANPFGTAQTHLAASEAYRFLQAPDRIGIVYREGLHQHALTDWQVFLDFADWQLLGKPSSRRYDQIPFLNAPPPS